MSNAMDDEIDEDEDFRGPRPRPLWVSMGLWGLPGRGWAWAFFWVTVVISAACTVYGFVSWPFFAGSVVALAAWWYYAAIRWVDRHGDWP